MFSLKSPHGGDFNDYTQYTICNIKKKITQNYPKYTAMRFFPKGLKNEFEPAVVNEPSVFELLKFYCSRARTYCACSRCAWGIIIFIFSSIISLFSHPLPGRRLDID